MCVKAKYHKYDTSYRTNTAEKQTEIPPQPKTHPNKNQKILCDVTKYVKLVNISIMLCVSKLNIVNMIPHIGRIRQKNKLKFPPSQKHTQTKTKKFCVM